MKSEDAPSPGTVGRNRKNPQKPKVQAPAPNAFTEEADAQKKETYSAQKPDLIEQETERLLEAEENTKENDSKHQDTAATKKKRLTTHHIEGK